MNDTIKITSSGRDFDKAVKYLKKLGGKFDPTSKTWVMPAGKIDADDCRVFGLQKVAAASSEPLPYSEAWVREMESETSHW